MLKYIRRKELKFGDNEPVCSCNGRYQEKSDGEPGYQDIRKKKDISIDCQRPSFFDKYGMTYIVSYVTKGQWEWGKINGCGILRGIEAGNMHKLWKNGSSTTSPVII